MNSVKLKQFAMILLIFTSVSLVGCRTMTAFDALETGSTLLQAASINDAQLMQEAKLAGTALDQKNQLAPKNSKYQKRIAKLTKKLQSVNNVPLDVRVYMTKDINAFAMANGTVRVYSGLMDAMNDDELLFVIGHEIGHVASGHTKERMRNALLVKAGREVVSKTADTKIAQLTDSQLGDFIEKVINAQFSQANERQADDYGLETLKQSGRNPTGAATALEKLAALGSGQSNFVMQMLSTHPEPAARAERIRKAIQNGGAH